MRWLRGRADAEVERRSELSDCAYALRLGLIQHRQREARCDLARWGWIEPWLQSEWSVLHVEMMWKMWR